MRQWWTKVRAVLARRRSLAEELNEEIAAHLDLAAKDHIAAGMDPDAARAAARRHFGNVLLTRERAHEAWRFPGCESFLQDLRYGWRGILRAPSFALVIILTLALGIGATTAIFSVVDTVLLRPLPYPAAERLVWLGEASRQANGISVTWINYQHWRRDNRSFEEMAAYRQSHLTLTGRGEPLLTRAGEVTSSFFGLIGLRPVAGRLFGESDDRWGAARTVLLSHRFWVERLAADPRALGAMLDLDGKSYQIVGIAGPGPAFFGKPVDFYLPLGLSQSAELSRSEHGSIRALGRLKPAATLAAAQADLDRIMRQLAAADPGPESDHRAAAALLGEYTTREYRPALLMLLGTVGLVLAIACANVASLILARSTARAGEIAIRTAIGGGRKRLVRQLLTESLLLSALGGVGGLLLAQGLLRR
jgi:predicted permease